MGTSQFITQLLSPLSSLQFLFDKAIIGILIFIIGLIIGRVTGNFVQRLLKELEVSAVLKRATNVQITLEDKVGSIVRYLIYFFGALVALNHIGLTTPILSMIAGAILVIIIIAFLLGVKDYIPNMIAGFRIQKNGIFKKGDVIRVGDVQGKVKVIRLVETEIEEKGDVIFVPNATIVRSNVKVIKS